MNKIKLKKRIVNKRRIGMDNLYENKETNNRD